MKAIRIFGLAALALLVCVQQAAATTILTMTFSGSEETNGGASGFDTANLFGGGQLQFADFTATYKFALDPANLTSTATTDTLDGGLISASLKIGTETFNVPVLDVTSAQLFDAHSSGFNEISAAVSGAFGSLQTYFYNFGGGTIPSSLTSPFTYSQENGVVSQGSFSFGSETLQLRPSEVTLQVAAVPEPATWVLMLLGFAGIGFLAYRKNQRTPAVA